MYNPRFNNPKATVPNLVIAADQGEVDVDAGQQNLENNIGRYYFYLRRDKYSNIDEDPLELLARKQILHPRECQRKTTPLKGSISGYLKACHDGLLSEYWNSLPMLLSVSAKAESYHSVQGIVEDSNGDWILDNVFSSAKGSVHKTDIDDSSPFKSLAGNLLHLAIFRGHLCLTSRHGNSIKLLRGQCIQNLEWREEITQETRFRDAEFHVCILGYVGSFIHELIAIYNFMHCPTSLLPRILDLIANPGVIGQFQYAQFSEHAIRGGIPCNEEQMTIIKGLQNEIEAIRGPPGTGGSRKFSIRERCSYRACILPPHTPQLPSILALTALAQASPLQ